MRDLSIGQVAAKTGLNASAIRYYEMMGIVPKPYRLNGRRVFDEKWLNNLGFTMLALDAGFRIAEIQQMMAEPPDTPPSTLFKTMADDKIAELDAQIKHIEQMKKLLNMVSSCGCESVEYCGELALNKLYRQKND